MDEKGVLDLIELGRIFDLSPGHFNGRQMSIKEMVAIFQHFNAFYLDQCIPSAERPHFIIRSGHSNGIILCKEVLKYPPFCLIFAYEILKLIEQTSTDLTQTKVVVSSAYSAINLGWELTRLLSLKYCKEVEYVIAEKDSKGSPTIIRGGIDPSKKVLIINELMTTSGGSTYETKLAVLNCNGENPPPEIIEPAFVLVHCSPDYSLSDGSPIEAVFHFDMQTYSLENSGICPYCEAGSLAVQAKL